MPRKKAVAPPPKPKPVYVVTPRVFGSNKRFLVIGTYPDGTTDVRPMSAVDDEETAHALAERFNKECSPKLLH